MRRVLLEDAVEGTVELRGPRFHHLAHVLRARAGDVLEVFDGKGRAFPAAVESIQPEFAVLVLGAEKVAARARHLCVVQAMPRGEKLEWVLQKGTELGAASFRLAWAERCVVKPSGREDGKRDRWVKIVEEAARQCGRSDVPEVVAPLPLAEAVRGFSGRLLVLDEEERAVRLSVAVAASLETDDAFALVVGPEGGLTRAEVSSLLALGALPVTLGSNVLRTETAALAALAVLRHLDGHFG